MRKQADTQVKAGFVPMSLVKWTFIGLLVLPAAELAAFILVAAQIGWFRAAVLFVVTSVLGVMLLRRSGRDNLKQLRAAFVRDGLRAVHLETPGVAAMLGGILLIFPGFITDIVGAALFVPTTRRWLAGTFARLARRPRSEGRDERVIDLDPADWHRIPDRARRRRSKSDG
jgi:UPF0716 protein FxsA